jgi:IS30 family transposase
MRLFAPMPPALRKTVTFDNGTEFARHRALQALAVDTYFCDPCSPWQKGGIENAIGRMCRFMAPQNRPRYPLEQALERAHQCLQQHS